MQRSTVKAQYRGKPVVWPIEQITHFHSADKYTVAHHVDGRELLLNDSLRALADEFREHFLLINRGVLVARGRILQVIPEPKHIAGLVYLQGVADPLPCSRSRLPVVREFLNCAA
jgi:DNA-binding LytR/AlgR family response regulator